MAWHHRSIPIFRARLLELAAVALMASPVLAQGTTRVSVDAAGVQANGRSYSPSISSGGRYVAFQSGAINLVSGDTNGFDDVFVHDRQTGQTSRGSVASAGWQATRRRSRERLIFRSW